MVREFSYKGYDLEQLKKLPIDQLKEIMPYGARRKINRGIKLDKKMLRAIEANKAGNPPKNMVKTHSRDLLVMPDMVGLKLGIYNGKIFEQVEIKPEMIGCYIGDFVLSRKIVSHGKAGIGATKSSKNVAKK
ncbi:MAG: 30S ribosomal protein S19 [Candidatus Diapherotrites archaeon CG09_land_8_20_14_0_10_32_12]|nr:MAG: 30S ribosomal protein S19 [Candidatus Diapherotrites archaeon CG09_land_8_20_14_0_10_32_12]